MQTSEKKMNEWASLKESGDVKKIAAVLKVSTVRTSEILNTGSGSVDQIEAINAFYKYRRRKVGSINK